MLVDLDVHSKIAYWTYVDLAPGAQGLFRANADGTAWTAIESSSDVYWGGVRADDNYIFYFHAGALYRRMK